MDSLVTLDKRTGRLSFLPQVRARALHNERYRTADKQVAPCTGGRNSMIGLLVGETGVVVARTPKRDHRYLRIAVIESANNLTSYYAITAAVAEGVHAEMHVISSAVHWGRDQYELLKNRASFFSNYDTVGDMMKYVDGESLDICFLDACGSIHKLLNDVFITMDALNKTTGGAWGATWMTSRHIPSEDKEEVYFNGITNYLVKDIGGAYVATSKGGEELLNDWMHRYCVRAGEMAGFEMRLAYQDCTPKVCTQLYRAVPLRQALTTPHLESYTRETAFKTFWAGQMQARRANGGLLERMYVQPILKQLDDKEEEQPVQKKRR